MKVKLIVVLICFFVLIPFRIAQAMSGASGQKIVDRIYDYLKEGYVPKMGMIDLKAGVDVLGSFSNVFSESSYSSVPSIGFTVSAEYIKPVSSLIRAGAGISYITPRKLDKLNENDGYGSFLPVYAILQVNPIWFLQILYLRFNLGYGFLLYKAASSELQNHLETAIGGLTWGLGFGFPVSHGWGVDLSYNMYFLKIKYDGEEKGSESAFGKFTVSVYKRFKLSDF
jgi:hypothetical protein